MRRLKPLFVAALLCVAGSFPAHAGTADSHLASADRLWAENKLDEAGRAFEAAAKAEPESPAVLLRLAGFQLARLQTTASIANYRRVISVEPENSKAWIGLGMAYLHSARRELAKAAFEEAVRVDPARKEALTPVLAKLKE